MSRWIQTNSGKQFVFLAAKPNFDINDIAHGLSCLNRFNGQADDWWTVGQHSLLVSDLTGLIWQRLPDEDRICPENEARLLGLMHDATEAYCSDINSPLKNLPGMHWYKKFEDKLFRKISRRFGLVLDYVPPMVKYADAYALKIEYGQLFEKKRPDWKTVDTVKALSDFGLERFNELKKLSWKEVKGLFLKRFEELRE